MMKSGIDKTITGLILGILLPAASFLIIFLVTPGEISFFDYLTDVITSGKVTRVVSLCVIPAVILFFVFNRLDMLKGAKGVLAATFIWVLVIVIDRIL